jgi:hypothetical protein
LVEGFRKDFSGGPADRSFPDVIAWRIEAPNADTRDPIVLRFPKPMDYALLQHAVSVFHQLGTVAITANETEWRFTPYEKWRAGDYTLVANSPLEDYAGNRPDRLFDVDLRVGQPHELTAFSVTLPFTIAK